MSNEVQAINQVTVKNDKQKGMKTKTCKRASALTTPDLYMAAVHRTKQANKLSKYCLQVPLLRKMSLCIVKDYTN